MNNPLVTNVIKKNAIVLFSKLSRFLTILFEETANTIMNVIWNRKGVSFNMSKDIDCYQLFNNSRIELFSFSNLSDYFGVRFGLKQKIKKAYFCPDALREIAILHVIGCISIRMALLWIFLKDWVLVFL